MAGAHKPVVLIIMDGWGHRENPQANAIHAANTPNWDRIWSGYPHTLVYSSGAAVGLPGDQMGNSEVGHLNLGSGRVVYQEFTRVSRSIRTGSFFTNQTLIDAADAARQNNSAIHIIGLLSAGGVHSHEDHIHAMVKLAIERGVEKVYVHASLDGRDTPPKSAADSVRGMQEQFDRLGGGQIATLIGRYFSMDRDHRWPRIQAAYDLITQGKAEFETSDPMRALEAAYQRGETDEFVQGSRILDSNGEIVKINDGDAVVFMNFRSDRARQITRAFIEPDFDGFERAHWPKLATFTSLTEYKDDFDVPVAFPPERLDNVFGEYISSLGMRQLRIAETEKYAHVTFFFNGGREAPYEGEDRILVPSPQVATYDEQPEMNAPELTDKLVAAIELGLYDAIVCNYANADMVGHTGNFDAAVEAVEAVDKALGRVVAALEKAGGELLVTADHGNAEQMEGKGTGQAHTAHTTYPVPFVYVGRPAAMSEHGALSDVVPTMLMAMGLKQPPEMTGRSLIEFSAEEA